MKLNRLVGGIKGASLALGRAGEGKIGDKGTSGAIAG